MPCSFGTEVAFSRNRKGSKIPPVLWRADSALATRLTVASFDPRSSGFERHARPALELEAKFTAQRWGRCGQTTRRARSHIPDASPAPGPAVLHLAIIAHFQRWLGALTGSSRVSEEAFPQGRPALIVSRKAPAKSNAQGRN